MPLVMPSPATSASPLSRMVAAMRAKSPFSHSALFGFIAFRPSLCLYANCLAGLSIIAETRTVTNLFQNCGQTPHMRRALHKSGFQLGPDTRVEHAHGKSVYSCDAHQANRGRSAPLKKEKQPVC